MRGNRFINLKYARNDEQRAVMEQIREAGECPFCEKNLGKYHRKSILKTGTHWLLTENQWKYEHADAHLLLISRKHIENLSEISNKAWSELLQLLCEAMRTAHIEGGGCAMRFGAPQFTGATVTHLHFHLIKPENSATPNHKPVLFPIG